MYGTHMGSYDLRGTERAQDPCDLQDNLWALILSSTQH